MGLRHFLGHIGLLEFPRVQAAMGRQPPRQDPRWPRRPVADSLNERYRCCAWVPCLRPTARCAVGLHGMTVEKELLSATVMPAPLASEASERDQAGTQSTSP